MKILFILFMLFLPYMEKTNIVVVDSETKERLIGAKIITESNTYYTDFNGWVQIDVNKNDTIKVEYISYKTTIKVIEKSSIIELESE